MLTDRERKILKVLSDNEVKGCFLGMQTIGDESGYSSKCTVWETIQSLKEKGVIEELKEGNRKVGWQVKIKMGDK